ncbi:MAG TPA: mechanosensitive ion channel family protein [Gammaproteobacteria bacterium]|jgi:small-conductance mechanosensitive channel
MTIIRYDYLPTALVSLLLGLVLSMPLPAAAQQSADGETPAVEIPENLTREEVRDLVARLSDDQVRDLVITQLDKLAVSAQSESQANVYLARLRAGVREARESLRRSLNTREKPLQTLAANAWGQLTADGTDGSRLLLQLLVLLAAGLGADRLARILLRRASAIAVESLSLSQKFDIACYRAAVGAMGIAAFAVGAMVAVELIAANPAAESLWYQLIWLIVTVRAVMLIVSQIVSPKSSSTRMVELSDAAASEAWIWSLALTLSLAVPKQIGSLARELGATEDHLLLMGMLLGPVFLLLSIALILRLRKHGTRLIIGNDGSVGILRQGLARVWWLLAIAYIVLIWLMALGARAATGESSLLPGLVSLLLMAAIPYFDRGLKWLIACYFDDDRQADAAPDEQAAIDTGAAGPTANEIEDTEQVTAPRPNYYAVALRYGRVLMSVAILAIFIRLWNIDVAAISAQLVGERFARASFDIAITILLTWALWGVIRIAIERKIAEDKGPEGASDEAEAGGVGGTRIGTVLPLIRAFIQITLIVMAVLISLSALGVNIGPLIAGAGVIGLAIGFGAQTLVRDIVSGLFYLIDDAFRVGEYVVIDQIRGTVEKISIRSFQLRHHNGPVHTIPYGEIRSLTNWSRDWAIMKFELRIPFETDIEKVRKIIKKIGQELIEDETFGPLLLAPLKSQGVNRMDDSALIIRCKFTAVPGQQYLIRREAFTRIQKAFEEEGIHFAPRRVLVEATTPKQAIEAAAATIDREGEGQQQSSPDEP